ncbi:ATP-binding protein [Mycoplasma sp. CSL10166]|uniref:ATP-binding protein n=1 Tax=Mycoplasma sp. CSL10166 TaxID=2813825 RepID=UPI00197B92F2|nr:ATP-binding protein [Mycoplasma sp. CSL10166]MBN4084132.1 AAA family ATPase [Mycoplasma sp. CSL10166]
MKKARILNLIKYFSEKNDIAFKNEAYEIASEFDRMGDYSLAEYIMGLLSEGNTFFPQMIVDNHNFIKKIKTSSKSLPIPDIIKEDVIGIINATTRDIGINKFLFVGPPGTGKTETSKHIARILGRELFVVDFSTIIDSKLGQTSKNISKLFDEINNLRMPDKVVILFDEIDALAMERVDSNDLREMGRATTAVLNGLDQLNDKVILIATTNLYKHFDKALIRRFDSVINFDRYSRDDLIDISEIILNDYIKKMDNVGKNIRLFRKIINLYETIPYPGELKNIIRTSLAFSKLDEEFDYLKRLYNTVKNGRKIEIKELQTLGFTLREIEILTSISKSQLSRELKE